MKIKSVVPVMVSSLVYTFGFTLQPGQAQTGSPSTANAEFLYVVSNPSEEVNAYRIDPGNGNLLPVPGQPFEIYTSVPPAACNFGCFINPVGDPLGRFFYYDFQELDDAGFGTMHVNAHTGALEGGHAALIENGTASPIATDPFGRFIFGNQSGEGQSNGQNYVQSYAVVVDGSLTPAQGQPFEYPGNLSYSAPAVAANFLFVSNYYTDYPQPSYLYGFSIDGQSGVLTQVSSAADGVEATNQVITPNGRFLYADQNYSNPNNGAQCVEIVGYQVGSNGSLVQLNQAPQQTPDFAAVGMAISPNGKFLYNVAYDDVRVYDINQETGALTLVAMYSTINTGSQMAIDSTTQFAYFNESSTDSSGNPVYTVNGYSIDPSTGALTPLPGAKMTFPNYPTGLAIVRPQ